MSRLGRAYASFRGDKITRNAVYGVAAGAVVFVGVNFWLAFTGEGQAVLAWLIG